MPLSDRQDSACPLSQIKRFDKKLTLRFPDAIGIGFPKCGTSALSFLDCHSKFVFRRNDPYYWNNDRKCSLFIT